MQRNIVQNRLVGTIAEANILEHYIAGERNIAGHNALIVPLGLLVHHLSAPARAANMVDICIETIFIGIEN